MCACRQKRSFLIADILGDTTKKTYKNLSFEPSQTLVCKKRVETSETVAKVAKETRNATNVMVENASKREENLTRFNVRTEVQKELEISKASLPSLETRRNTYPLHPTPLKPSYSWNYRGRESLSYMEPRVEYYSDQMLNSSQLLRSQLATNRYMSHPLSIRHSYGFDRVPPSCCSPWWGVGGRRKGGQVRFTAAQTGALERRFNASKYLSPDERRALATSLRLSDRQVKTWFQNRRAKWRRTTPDSADAASPPSSAEDDDDDIQVADDSL